MRILFLSQWFQPEPSFKGLPFAKALKNRGHHVDVLTGFPNYPGGKVYPGYRVHIHQHEIMEDIDIHRVALYPSHNKSAIRRIINYLSFTASTLLFCPLLKHHPDVIYVYNLVTLLPTALLMRFIFGSKIIMDVLDIWPESVSSSAMLKSKAVLDILDKLCKWLYRKPDKLVVPSPGVKRALIDMGALPEKIEVIYNWCDESSIQKEISTFNSDINLEFSDKFVILFAGTMGIVQGLDTLLDCAEICKETIPKVQFVLIGGGVDRQRLEQRTNEMRLDNVTFLPYRPIESMGEIYAIADALIVHLRDEPLFRITVPSKTQAYLYIGKPVIMAVRGDAEELVKQAGAGIICNSENPREMANVVETLFYMSDEERKTMGESGSRYYDNFLSFTAAVNKYEKLMLTTQ